MVKKATNLQDSGSWRKKTLCTTCYFPYWRCFLSNEWVCNIIYASFIISYKVTYFGCHQYPFEEFLVRAICCCSSRRAMSPFILEVSTELRMDLKSRWSSSVTHKHSDSNFVRQYFSCHWAFLFSFKIKFTFTSFPSSPIREFLVLMILEYVSFLLDKSFQISILHTGLPQGRHHLMAFAWQIGCSRANFDLGAHFIALFSNNRIIVIVWGESTAYRKPCKVLQNKGEVFVFVCLKAKSFMGQGVTQKWFERKLCC